MVVRAPSVEAAQYGSICVEDLTEVIVCWRRLRLAEQRLVPFEAARNVIYADDRPCAFHRIRTLEPTQKSQLGMTLDFCDRGKGDLYDLTVSTQHLDARCGEGLRSFHTANS